MIEKKEREWIGNGDDERERKSWNEKQKDERKRGGSKYMKLIRLSSQYCEIPNRNPDYHNTTINMTNPFSCHPQKPFNSCSVFTHHCSFQKAGIFHRRCFLPWSHFTHKPHIIRMYVLFFHFSSIYFDLFMRLFSGFIRMFRIKQPYYISLFFAK